MDSMEWVRSFLSDPPAGFLTCGCQHNQQLKPAFRVQGNAANYLANPNTGKLRAGQSNTVTVLLQPMKEDPTPDFVCKDEFFIRIVLIPPRLMDEASDNDQMKFWEMVDVNRKDQTWAEKYYRERKIFVDFLPRRPKNEVSNANQELSHIKTQLAIKWKYGWSPFSNGATQC
jgi:hypothetical protein